MTMTTPVTRPAGGRHLCGLAEGPSGRARLAAGWVRDGLLSGERVVWIDPDGGRSDGGALRDSLTDHGIVWHGPAQRGQLATPPPGDVVSLESSDDIPGRIAEVSAAARQAVDDGYGGLRVGIEVAEALTVMPDVTTQLRFEAAWEELTHREPVSLLCVYDPETYGPRLGEALAAHPRGLADRQASVEVAPGVVRLAGELDLYNTDRFSRFLRRVVRDEVVAIDLSALDFIDVRGAARLVEVSRSLGPGRQLQLVSPPRQLRTILELMGWADEVRLTDSEAA